MFSDLAPHFDKVFFLLLIIYEFYKPYRLKEKENLNHFSENFAHTLISHVLIFIGLGVLGFSFNYFDKTILSKGIISSLSLSILFKYLLSFVILDLSIYWQHRIFHRVPFLWKFHEIHHSDHVLSASSALRFHFGEIIISLAYKIVIIALFGIPLGAYYFFESFLFACAAFNHSNIKLSKKLEGYLKYVLVTPAFHRRHHALETTLQQTNYSFSVPWWDYLFKTFSKEQEIERVGLYDSLGDFCQQITSPFEGALKKIRERKRN